MKLIDRQAVEGTTPVIYIGHRPYRDKRTGKAKISKTWYAEYCLDARSYYEPLKTTNKTVAARAAHKITDRLEAGQAKAPSRRRQIRELVAAYLEMLNKRGRAPKTLEKYTFVLNGLADWAEVNGRRSAAAFGEREVRCRACVGPPGRHPSHIMP